MSDITADQARLDAARRSQSRINILLSLTLLGLLLLLWAVLAVSTRNFLTPINITNLMRQAYLVAILAVGQTFVIITAGIDLSVGAVIGFCSVILALLLKAQVAIPVAVLLTLLMGAAIGAFHGFGIVRLGLVQTALGAFCVFYVVCVAVTWFVYVRRGTLMHAAGV